MCCGAGTGRRRGEDEGEAHGEPRGEVCPLARWDGCTRGEVVMIMSSMLVFADTDRGVDADGEPEGSIAGGTGSGSCHTTAELCGDKGGHADRSFQTDRRVSDSKTKVLNNDKQCAGSSIRSVIQRVVSAGDRSDPGVAVP